jgi:hypothetical protein
MRQLLCLLLLVVHVPAHAVVVAGANGGGNTSNNTTAGQMAAQLGLANADFYHNVLPYSDATAVYLGWAQTDVGPRAFLLSAMHITLSNTMLINAVSYSVTRESIAGSDLALLTLTNVDGIMPPLPVMNLAASTPAIGTDVIMAGFGRERVQDATTDADVSDAIVINGGEGYTTTTSQVMRWGTNTTVRAGGPPGQPSPTATITVGGRPTVAFLTQFDEPDTGEWLTTSQAQAVRGDSGGAAFDFDGNLRGITVAVGGSSADLAVFGDVTWFADVTTYKDDIDEAIGYALVPEPSTWSLLVLAAVATGWVAVRKSRRFRA